jgi:hypothetical protein
VACLAATYLLLAFGKTSLDFCMDAAGRAAGAGEKGWMRAYLDQLLPLLPYALGLIGLAIATIKLAHTVAVTVLAHLAAALPLLLALANFSPLSAWHQCDRKGCTGCDGVELLLMVTAAVLVLLLAIAALMAFMNRNRRPSGFSR